LHHDSSSVNQFQGSAELKATFGAKKHELSVSTYQMVILLLFNDRGDLSYKDLKEMSGIPIADLKKNLLSLSSAKYKILNKEPDSKKVDDTDTFSFNSKFKSKLFKVKVMTVVQKESEPERQETRQKVDEDRKHQYPLLLLHKRWPLLL
jgi:cullin 3